VTRYATLTGTKYTGTAATGLHSVANEISEWLYRWSIDNQKIVAIASDSGANMKKAAHFVVIQKSTTI